MNVIDLKEYNKKLKQIKKLTSSTDQLIKKMNLEDKKQNKKN